MYLDAIIVIALIIVAFCWFRRISKFIYAMAIIDMFLRLLHYVANNIGIKGFDKWVNNIFPDSILSIINKYSSGLLCEILTWFYVGIMVLFLCYTVRAFFRKKC